MEKDNNIGILTDTSMEKDNNISILTGTSTTPRQGGGKYQQIALFVTITVTVFDVLDIRMSKGVPVTWANVSSNKQVNICKVELSTK